MSIRRDIPLEEFEIIISPPSNRLASMCVNIYEDGKFKINDPNSPANSAKLWDFDEFDQDIKIMWSFSG